MRKNFGFATALLRIGLGLLFALPLAAVLISYATTGPGPGAGILFALALPGILTLMVGATLYAAAHSHRRKHRFLSEGRGRTMHSHDGGHDREKLERKADR